MSALSNAKAALADFDNDIIPGGVPRLLSLSEALRRLIGEHEKLASPVIDDAREKLAEQEAILYANDEDAQEDFITGWRTADRTPGAPLHVEEAVSAVRKLANQSAPTWMVSAQDIWDALESVRQDT